MDQTLFGLICLLRSLAEVEAVTPLIIKKTLWQVRRPPSSSENTMRSNIFCTTCFNVLQRRRGLWIRALMTPIRHTAPLPALSLAIFLNMQQSCLSFESLAALNRNKKKKKRPLQGRDRGRVINFLRITEDDEEAGERSPSTVEPAASSARHGDPSSPRWRGAWFQAPPHAWFICFCHS